MKENFEAESESKELWEQNFSKIKPQKLWNQT